MHRFAAVTTHGDTDGDLEVLNGSDSVYIYGILVSNADATANLVTFSDNDGTQVLHISVPIGESFSYEVPFLADNGFKVDDLGGTIGPDVFVTIHHGQGGA